MHPTTTTANGSPAPLPPPEVLAGHVDRYRNDANHPNPGMELPAERPASPRISFRHGRRRTTRRDDEWRLPTGKELAAAFASLAALIAAGAARLLLGR